MTAIILRVIAAACRMSMRKPCGHDGYVAAQRAAIDLLRAADAAEGVA
jgi:hypothetical protein